MMPAPLNHHDSLTTTSHELTLSPTTSPTSSLTTNYDDDSRTPQRLTNQRRPTTHLPSTTPPLDSTTPPQLTHAPPTTHDDHVDERRDVLLNQRLTHDERSTNASTPQRHDHQLTHSLTAPLTAPTRRSNSTNSLIHQRAPRRLQPLDDATPTKPLDHSTTNDSRLRLDTKTPTIHQPLTPTTTPHEIPTHSTHQRDHSTHESPKPLNQHNATNAQRSHETLTSSTMNLLLTTPHEPTSHPIHTQISLHQQQLAQITNLHSDRATATTRSSDHTHKSIHQNSTRSTHTNYS